jgi:hypothetical protein
MVEDILRLPGIKEPSTAKDTKVHEGREGRNGGWTPTPLRQFRLDDGHGGNRRGFCAEDCASE